MFQIYEGEYAVEFIYKVFINFNYLHFYTSAVLMKLLVSVTLKVGIEEWQ